MPLGTSHAPARFDIVVPTAGRSSLAPLLDRLSRAGARRVIVVVRTHRSAEHDQRVPLDRRWHAMAEIRVDRVHVETGGRQPLEQPAEPFVRGVLDHQRASH